MFNESLLVTRISSQTGYTVDLLENSQFAWSQSDLTNPEVRIGHLGIKPQGGNDRGFYSDGYSDLEKDLILITKIEIYCLRSDLATVRKNVADAYKNWTPLLPSGIPTHSAVFFMEAEMSGVSNRNVWWSELVGTIFPATL